jgi:hypothetical protein
MRGVVHPECAKASMTSVRSWAALVLVAAFAAGAAQAQQRFIVVASTTST